MANKKMTMVEKFDATKALLMGETPAVPFTIEDAIAFMDDRKGQAVKKNSSADRKPTPKELEKMAADKAFTDAILSVLATAENPMSVGEITKAHEGLVELSNQKMTSLLTALVKANTIVRTEIKGKAHFALAPSAE